MASPNAGQLLEATQDLYLLLERNLSLILAKCTSAAQRRRVIAQCACARTAFRRIRYIVSEDRNDTVKTMYVDLKATTAKIASALRNLQSIAAFLQLVTEGVRQAGALAALGAEA